jgi:BNR repeat-like domain
MKVLSESLSVRVLLFVLLVLGVAVLVLPNTEFYREWSFEGKAKIREGGVKADVVNASSENKVTVAPPSPNGFSPQVRLGFTSGDQWEPAIASDRFGHVYILYPQYLGVPGCAECSDPTMILQLSNDGGNHWNSPTLIHSAGAVTGGQWDAQIVVDPEDRQTVYAAWLENKKSDVIVAKSTDFGVNWTYVTADSTNANTDKPILAVQGQDVYVAYNHSQQVWTAFSHDGGATFTEVKVNQNAKLGWSLAGGGTITPDGSVYFSWDGYEQSGQAKGKVNLYISKSTDGGVTWTTKLIEVSSSPPDCSVFFCGWAFLGA